MQNPTEWLLRDQSSSAYFLYKYLQSLPDWRGLPSAELSYRQHPVRGELWRDCTGTCADADHRFPEPS